MMVKARKALKREVLPAKKQTLVARSKQLDREIRREVGSLDRSMTKLAGMLAKMRAEHLWQYLRGFHKFEDYAQHVLGKMARSKVFNLVAIHGLTEGPNPIPAEMVERIGHKKAVELARLSPEERTPDMVKSAMEDALPVVRRRVQEKLNESLPPEQRKEPVMLFARNYPPEVIEAFEELEADGVYMEGIRDGDASLTLRAKFMFAMVCFFREAHEAELEEAREYRSAMQSKNSKEVAEELVDRGHSDVPEPERPRYGFRRMTSLPVSIRRSGKVCKA